MGLTNGDVKRRRAAALQNLAELSSGLSEVSRRVLKPVQFTNLVRPRHKVFDSSKSGSSMVPVCYPLVSEWQFRLEPFDLELIQVAKMVV